MTALELYKFVADNGLEYHWNVNWDMIPALTDIDAAKPNDVMLFVPIIDIPVFNTMLGSHIMGEEGIDCVMKEGYFAFWMKDICDYFGLDMEKIFDKSK
jgi:hypothetical protein